MNRRWYSIRPAFLALIGFAVFALVQSPGLWNGTIVWDERFSEYIPWRVEIARQWASGDFPFFTDRIFAGMPAFSTAYVGALYPPNVLYAVVPAVPLSHLLEALHTILAGLGMYAYLRGRRCVPAVAFLGGVFFQYSGFLLVHQPHVSMREAACLAPWVAWRALRLTHSPNARRAGLLALALALQMSVGYVQVVLFTVLWIALDWLVDVGTLPRNRAATGWLALGGAVGIAMAAVQVLPTLEHTKLTPRVGLDVEKWQLGSFAPQQAVAFVSPKGFGTPGWQWMLEEPPSEVWQPLSATVGTLAILSLPLLLRWRGRRRLVAFYALATAATLVLATGKYFGPNAQLFHVPPFNMFRIPARWLLLTHIGAVVLAALTLQRLLHARWWQRGGYAILGYALFGALAIAAFVLACLRLWPVEKAWETLPWVLWKDLNGQAGHVSWWLGQRGLPTFGGFLDTKAAGIVLGFAALPLLAGLRRFPRTVATIVLLVLVVDWWALSRYCHADGWCPTPVLAKREHPLLHDLPEEEFHRLYALAPWFQPEALALPGNTAMFGGFHTLGGYCPLLTYRLETAIGMGQLGNTWRDHEILRNPAPLALLGVTHLLVEPARFSEPDRLALAEQVGVWFEREAVYRGTERLRFLGARPRYDFAFRWRPIDTPEQADDLVWGRVPSPSEPATTLERARFSLLPPMETPLPRGAVTVLEERPAFARLRVEAPEATVLLIRDVWWPGWRFRIERIDNASYDEELKAEERIVEDRVMRANGLIRAVPIPRGTSVVELVYEAPGFRSGLRISLLAVAATLALLFGARLRKSRRQPR